jgi:predicted nucleic acid binding AN1-type Zn finger protein
MNNINKNILMKKEVRQKKIRCTYCRKKCDIINFRCKCEGVFCIIHRYSHSHDCEYNGQRIKDKRKELEINNPKSESPKIDKI